MTPAAPAASAIVTKDLPVGGRRVIRVPVATRPEAVPQRDWDRIGRINDAIITRVRYDHARLVRGDERELQSPNATLGSGLGICMDYSALFESAARRQGYAVTSVISDTLNHAWNAIRVGGRWRMIDVTWNAGDSFADGGAIPDHVRADPDFRRRFFLTTRSSERELVRAGLMRQSHDVEDITRVDLGRTLQAMAIIRRITALLDAASGGSGAASFRRGDPTKATIDELYARYRKLEDAFPLAVTFRLESSRG